MSGETKKLERDIKRVAKTWERNISSGLQTTLADTARVLQGDFNNYGKSMARLALFGVTGGTMSQEKMQRVTGETGSERFARETREKEEAQVAADIQADIQAREDERRQQIIRRIAAEIESRRMAPGTSLLTTAALSQQSPGNTILTSRG
jgi:hypothetical protein